jgi:hypothetical protein
VAVPFSPNPTVSFPVSGATVSTAGVNCSDIGNDFQGSSGVVWCVTLVSADGVSPCSINSTGSNACLATGLSIMSVMKNASTGKVIPSRTYGICSPSGVFGGWLCF